MNYTENKKTPLLVGFIGTVGSGKDTAADFLEDYYREQHPEKYTFRFAFADIIKNIVNDTFGLRTIDADTIKRLHTVKPFNGKTLREVYQTFGESIKSHFGTNFWVAATIKELNETRKTINANLIMCTDVRYSYEAAALKKYAQDNGFDIYLIRMNNLNTTQRYDNKSLKDLHISEQLKDIQETHTIKAKLIDEIDQAIRKIFKGNI